MDFRAGSLTNEQFIQIWYKVGQINTFYNIQFNSVLYFTFILTMYHISQICLMFCVIGCCLMCSEIILYVQCLFHFVQIIFFPMPLILYAKMFLGFDVLAL